MGLSARLADGIRHPAPVLLVHVVDDDPGAFGREAPADPLAESRPAPGDDRYLSFQTHALLPVESPAAVADVPRLQDYLNTMMCPARRCRTLRARRVARVRRHPR